MSTDTITLTIGVDDAQDLLDVILDRPIREDWSNRVGAALLAAGVTPLRTLGSLDAVQRATAERIAGI